MCWEEIHWNNVNNYRNRSCGYTTWKVDIQLLLIYRFCLILEPDDWLLLHLFCCIILYWKKLLSFWSSLIFWFSIVYRTFFSQELLIICLALSFYLRCCWSCSIILLSCQMKLCFFSCWSCSNSRPLIIQWFMLLSFLFVLPSCFLNMSEMNCWF